MCRFRHVQIYPFRTTAFLNVLEFFIYELTDMNLLFYVVLAITVGNICNC